MPSDCWFVSILGNQFLLGLQWGMDAKVRQIEEEGSVAMAVDEVDR